jgi:hypothetical protein
MYYADVTLSAGASLPSDPDHDERAIYTVAGEIDIAGDTFSAGLLLVLTPRRSPHGQGKTPSTHNGARWRAKGRTTLYLVEFCVLQKRPDRTGEGRLENGAFRQRARRFRIHPSSRERAGARSLSVINQFINAVERRIDAAARCARSCDVDVIHDRSDPRCRPSCVLGRGAFKPGVYLAIQSNLAIGHANANFACLYARFAFKRTLDTTLDVGRLHVVSMSDTPLTPDILRTALSADSFS